LGEQLAALHRVQAKAFGLEASTYLGPTAQKNDPHTDWPTFFWTRRLEPMLRAARERDLPIHLPTGAQERILAALDHQPAASLCHGDLWGGNAAQDAASGEPVIFDPAVSYADRETDLALTRLFGGFPPGFYRAYTEAWPLLDGHPERRDIYNLYHLIHHALLFGGGYAQQSQSILNRYA
jgi:fructosamine-3-kinase